jgi:LCP family protein required for cell wall assembly
VLKANAAGLIASKVGYAAACLVAAVVFVVSGVAHNVVGAARGLGILGITISGSPSVGAMNVLVMGLESRTDYQGNVLPNSLLTAMHAGKASAVAAGQVGSQDTNTLILIHIFAGGQRAVGYSIPRDDLVTYPQQYYPGVTQGKIDGAYYFAYIEYINQHTGTEDKQDLYLHANQAGQAATIATVQSVTGVHIDHFVEVNLAGFYTLAQAFGGIEVCIRPAPAQAGFAKGANLTDIDPQVIVDGEPTDNSGFNAYKDGYNAKQGGAQYLHLSAAQSLAFVRSRDTIPGVDLGRTHRQQATIDYVIWKLKHEGILTDITQLDGLLGSANHYLITDRDFDLLDFPTNMRALSGSNLMFQTLPISGQVNGMALNGSLQDVNTIDVPYIQQVVKNAFYPSSTAKPSTPTGRAAGKKAASVALAPGQVTVDVYNGSTASTAPLAGQTSAALVALGYKAGAVADGTAQSKTVTAGTQVFYGAGAAANAAALATQFGTTAVALKTLPADHVEVLIGSNVAAVPTGLTVTATATAGTQSFAAALLGGDQEEPASSTPTSSSDNGLAGGAVTVSPDAKFGIPCVY